MNFNLLYIQYSLAQIGHDPLFLPLPSTFEQSDANFPTHFLHFIRTSFTKEFGESLKVVLFIETLQNILWSYCLTAAVST